MAEYLSLCIYYTYCSAFFSSSSFLLCFQMRRKNSFLFFYSCWSIVSVWLSILLLLVLGSAFLHRHICQKSNSRFLFLSRSFVRYCRNFSQKLYSFSLFFDRKNIMAFEEQQSIYSSRTNKKMIFPHIKQPNQIHSSSSSEQKENSSERNEAKIFSSFSRKWRKLERNPPERITRAKRCGKKRAQKAVFMQNIYYIVFHRWHWRLQIVKILRLRIFRE